MSAITRRHFLTTTTGAGLAGVLATGIPPARGQQREISYLCWNNFAPLMDKKLAEIGQRFTKDTGIKLKIDHIAAAQQAAKYASEVQSQAGHDLVEMRMHFPWLYEGQLIDLGDVVADLEKKYGKVLSSAAETARVHGTWRAVPQYHAMFVATYREDLFKKAGLKIPDTWEDLYTVGKELKKMGHPVGIPISQNYDSISTAGRHETDVPRHIGIWKFSKNAEPGKEFIRYLLGKRETYDEFIMSADAFNLPVYEKLQDHPVLKTDPKYAGLRAEGVQYHCYGWPAPPSDKVQLITNSFIMPNMIAKAVTGTATKDAIVWAENEMKKVMAGS